MSWLLVALVPGLLMLAAFGLDRLEAWLGREHTPGPTAAAHARSRATGEVTDGLQRRLHQRRIAIEAAFGGFDEERLPTRQYPPRRTNPGFQETRYANRV